MRLTVHDQEASKIAHVILDGKRIETAIALDTDEGWVEVMIPRIIKEHTILSKKETSVDVPETAFDWERKRLFGKVEVIWHANTTSTHDILDK